MTKIGELETVALYGKEVDLGPIGQKPRRKSATSFPRVADLKKAAALMREEGVGQVEVRPDGTYILKKAVTADSSDSDLDRELSRWMHTNG